MNPKRMEDLQRTFGSFLKAGKAEVYGAVRGAVASQVETDRAVMLELS